MKKILTSLILVINLGFVPVIASHTPDKMVIVSPFTLTIWNHEGYRVIWQDWITYEACRDKFIALESRLKTYTPRWYVTCTPTETKKEVM